MTSPTITVTFEDVLAGRAYIRLSPVSRLLLLHWMGAPWNERIPDACLHPLQVEVLLHREREKIVHGASRLGKSVLGGAEVAADLMLPGVELGVVAQRFDHVGAEFQYVFKAMKVLFDPTPAAMTRLVFKHQSNYHDYDAETIWGARARGWSVDHDEGAAMLGRAFYRVVLGEGSHISKAILENRIMRALDGWSALSAQSANTREAGYLSIYTTPKEYEGCSAAEWERVQRQTNHRPAELHYGETDFAGTVWIREADIRENPHYDLSVYETRRKTLSKEAFDEQYRGKMVFKSGRVLPAYDPSANRRLSQVPLQEMRLAMGIDTGAYTAFVLCGVDRANRYYALDEVYTEKATLSETVEQVKEMLTDRIGPALGTTDLAAMLDRIEYWVIDPASQHKLDLMELLDITLCTPVGLHGGKAELLPTLNVLNDLFREGRLTLTEDCTWLDEQIKRYEWQRVRQRSSGAARAADVRAPKKNFDHCIDALRFATLTLLQAGPPIEPPKPVTWAEAWENQRRDIVFGPLRRLMNEADRRGGIPC